uniref:Uncharacterized protein n=1 Tax=Timema shepardi TaxID=629360 RepID=A0A7R9FYG2_TIMSH|nr:unnamed protein product [Timema shepardi]
MHPNFRRGSDGKRIRINLPKDIQPKFQHRSPCHRQTRLDETKAFIHVVTGDEATLVRGHFQTQVFQQSVTLTAKMWPEDNGTAPPSSPGGWKWGSWRIPNEHLPLLVGTVCGGALILLVLLAAIVWRCCVMPRRDKAYCARLDKEMLARQRSGIPPLPSHSAVFAAPKSGQWAYSSRLVGPPANPPLVAPPAHWFYNSRVLSPANLERIDPGPIPRSVSCMSTQLHNEALPNKKDLDPSRLVFVLPPHTPSAPLILQSSEKVAAHPPDKEGDRDNKERRYKGQQREQAGPAARL